VRLYLLSSPTLFLNLISSLKRSIGADIQGLKQRRRIRRTLVVYKSKLDVMPKIKGERATESLKTYAKSI
jgi:hypothetical protein